MGRGNRHFRKGRKNHDYCSGTRGTKGKGRFNQLQCCNFAKGRSCIFISFYHKEEKICTDCQNYPVMQSLKKSISKLKQSSDPFYNARIIKDSEEIRILKKASSVIDEMFELCTQTIKKGRRESELQTILMSFANANDLFDTGYRSTLNPLIIASGTNSSFPHAQVTKRKFADGDMITVDLTLRYRGYVSDATRTFGLGTISKEKEQFTKL
uniref:Peptidase M24 (PepQ) n=1 Tax=uncultured marine thaumarchaeote AD1000_04_C02 TaxID=1455881 RepID=A0A075FGT5_9ARCH|nr:peptidase M24 (pepQ) [uncultured marine thaumarchaeote AD1000_04_C02]